MQCWWENSGLGAKLDNKHRMDIEDLTGRLPILLNALHKIRMQPKDQSPLDGGDEIFQQLLRGLLESQEVVSMQQGIQTFGEYQIEKYKDTAGIVR